jgi:transcriptional repressor NrdR
MRCLVCNHTESRVIDSRPNQDHSQTRRRRTCESCGQRFTTYEVVQENPLLVIKRDGRREEFSAEKILKSMRRAIPKNAVPQSALEKLVDEISQELESSMIREVPHEVVAELVMEKIYRVDVVAYLRFASVYKNFTDPKDFLLEVEKLAESRRAPKKAAKGSEEGR